MTVNLNFTAYTIHSRSDYHDRLYFPDFSDNPYFLFHLDDYLDHLRPRSGLSASANMATITWPANIVIVASCLIMRMMMMTIEIL